MCSKPICRNASTTSRGGPWTHSSCCVRRWRHDDEDSHQPCIVVILQRFEADQIYHAVAAVTRALNTLVTALVHSRLDYCNVVFAGLPA